MIKKASSILLVVRKDKSRLTYSIPRDKLYQEVYNQAISNNEFEEEDVSATVYFPETDYTIEDVLYHYDHEKEEFDLKPIEVDKALDKFRKERGSLFKVLDMEFMRTLENKDCEECFDHIVSIKKHMRGLPDFLKEYLEKFTEKQIKEFDFFNNVYSIDILNGGTGYEDAPVITIEPPNGVFEGIQMEAEATVLEGKLIDIKIIRVGSGYVTAPKVDVSKSPSGNTAIVVASPPENDIIKLT